MFHKVLVLAWSLCSLGALTVRGHATEQYSLRLSGGDGRCNGELQIQRKGEDWYGVSPEEDVPLPFGDRACGELDCGPPLSMKKKVVPFRHAVQFTAEACVFSPMIHCLGKIEFSEHMLMLNCSDSVRQFTGMSLCSGSSLQIWDQSWAWICDGDLDRRGAEVLCRELGCGALHLQGELSPLGQMFQCEGHESALKDCPRTQTRTNAKTCPGNNLHLTCFEPVRLVGGASRCAGTMEVKYSGEWRRAMTSDLWDLEAAAVVCRVLDCGSAVSLQQRKDLKKEEVWNVRADCVKNRAVVRECVQESHPDSVGGLEVVCSDSVRLASGRSLCSGALQIRDQSWTSVCEGDLGRSGAEVLCRELGCGAPLLQGELSPLGQMFHCEGHESALKDCPSTKTRTNPGTCPGPAVQLTCSEPVRLVGGSGRCEGTVELNYRGEWRRVLPSKDYDHWDLETAGAVCRDLDCGSAVSAEERGGFTSSDAWVVRSDCVKKTNALRDCVSGGDSNRVHGLKVVCSDSVQWVKDGSFCSGNVKFRDSSLGQSWTSVCEGDLDRRGAEVLCRELGCGAPLLQGELSPLGQMFHCEGQESALKDCPRNQTRTNPGTCSGPALHLSCAEPVRLVGGAGRCEGTLEVQYRAEWRPVRTFGVYDHWDLESAAAVCRQLDCGVVVSTGRRPGLKGREVWELRPDCVKTASMKDCVWRGVAEHDDDLELTCSDSVRLISLQSRCSGSLQIRDQSLNQSWTSVCGEALDRLGEEVLCRELGCGAPVLLGELPPQDQVFYCEGHETSLMDCPRNQTRLNPETCSAPAFQLTCAEPVRLVGGASRCEGTVEVKNRGEWRRAMMSNLYKPWDIQAATAVCRRIRCGSAVSTVVRRRLDMSNVWFIRSECVKTTAMRDCILGGSPAWDGGLEVVCSGNSN